MEMKWEAGFTVAVRAERGLAVISADRAGLRSLANHLAALADQAPGSHFHLDAYNSLEEGSAELIVEKTE